MAFTMKYGEFDFIVSKSDVRFVNGYGIVTAQFVDEETCLLIGVVDKDYKEVLPLTRSDLAPRLFIAPNGNFIFTAYNSDINEFQVIHKNIDGTVINLGTGDFSEIDDEVIQLYYGEYTTLYDTQTMGFLTPFYHYVGPFIYSEKYGCKVAKAIAYIEDENRNVIDEISTIINTKGEVLEDYYDFASDNILASKDLTEALTLVRKKVSRN